MTQPLPPRLRLRLLFESGPAGKLSFGPGKADLLDLIGQHGSISAAARVMGMSYRRAWLLVDEMNQTFRNPLVESVRGGPQGGGARLTDGGKAALAHFRQIEAATLNAGAAEIAALTAMLSDISDGK
jgi:molybdate transport system regulatory protein